MKKIIIILTSVFILGSAFIAKEKEFTIKFSETEINKHWQKLEAIKQIVQESNLPHQQVLFIERSIDSLQISIANQVKKQISDTTTKK
jgi:hypothetical protein